MIWLKNNFADNSQLQSTVVDMMKVVVIKVNWVGIQLPISIFRRLNISKKDAIQNLKTTLVKRHTFKSLEKGLKPPRQP